MSYFLAVVARLVLLALVGGGSCALENTTMARTPIATPPDSNTIDSPRHDFCRTTTEFPFSCVEKACTAVGGLFNSANYSCSCPDSSRLFTSFFGGKCLSRILPISLLSEVELEALLTSSLDPKNITNDILLRSDSGNQAEGRLFSSEVNLYFGELTEAERSVMRAALTDSRGFGISNMSIPLIAGNFFSMKIVAGEGAVRTLLMENLETPEITLATSNPSHGHFRYYWEPNPARWPQLLQRTPHPQSMKIIFQSENDSFDDMRKEIVMVWDDLLRVGMRADAVHFFTENGCAGHCVIEQVDDLSRFNIRHVAEYVGGVSLRREIIILEKHMPRYHARSAVVEIDPSFSPNLVYLTETKVVDGSTDVIQSSVIYTGQGDKLYESPASVLVKNMNLEEGVRDASAEKMNNSLGSIVLCESGFNPSAFGENPSRKYRIGPMTNQSFWGWIGEVDDKPSISEQLSGVKYLTDLNVPYVDTGISLLRHSLSTAEIATERSGLSVISISLEHCFSGYNRWKNNVLPFARVVNVSATLPYDKHSCTSSPWYRQSVGDPAHSYLWVMAAGNESRSQLTTDSSLNCPQAFGGQSNVLVVSASSATGDEIASYSNSGELYADIAAGGKGFYSGEYGTSFAAPRVSRVAGLLAVEFPELSVAHLRAAIMLGSRVPYSTTGGWVRNKVVFPRFLPTRSGGSLDEQYARRVAQSLHKKWRDRSVDTLLARDLLLDMECNHDSEADGCLLAHKRLQWMYETKAFPGTENSEEL